MPPYAGEVDTPYADAVPIKDQMMVLEDDNSHVDDGTSTSSPSSTNTETTNKADKNHNGFDLLLDFNPCVGMHSMQSAVFKARPCSHCGKGCNKMSGYIKEIKGEDKIYYHKWCGQLKAWREVHAVQWQNVMSDLLAHFHAIQLAEERRLAAEHAAQLEQERRREEEERLKQAEALRQEAEAASDAKGRRRSKAARSYKKKGGSSSSSSSPSFAQKMGQQFKALKESLNCRNNKAVN